MTCQVDEEELKRLVQDEAMQLPDMNIAISGIAGRFPKADSMNEFEENLREGVDMVNDNDNSRFTCGLWGLPPRAGRLKDLSKFDSEFFGFTNEEANYIDFQLRILYEVVYESILDAGVNPATLRGTNTGVFFGLHCNEFENAMADDPNFKSNGYYAQFGVKVAQYFDFRGINITFDAACASGFVGLHNAVQALNDGLIEQAIVCSCNIPIHPTGSFIFLQMQMLSPTGFSRFLDSRADGYVKSEACVSVLLQRKQVALRNYASVMATMTSVDGYKAEGITFPSDKSQESLIRSTKELAGISTNHVEYLEAHGTGTPAGDPQEASAIANVYYPTLAKQEDDSAEPQVAEDNRKIGPILLGSVKTNMGHSEAASGLCALAKIALMLEHEVIYKGLNYAQPNPNIESLVDGRLKFVEETMPLKSKIIPLSCYGFGGSNVHAVLRANDKPALVASECDQVGSAEPEAPRLITMFGRSEACLNKFFDAMLDTESRKTRHCLSDDFLALLDSVNSGKLDRLMTYRGYVIVDRKEKKELSRSVRKCELSMARSNSQQNGLHPDDLGRSGHLQEYALRDCNLILPGIGCQWPGMADGLADYKPFWSTIERLAALLSFVDPNLNLIDLLIDLAEESNKTKGSLTGEFVSIVAYQIALINILRDGLKIGNPVRIVGHSLGEISCAYAANLFDERETLMIAYHMGKTLDDNRDLIGGKLVAVGLSEAEASKLFEGYQTVQVSCVNGPQSVTLSGTSEEMDRLCSTLDRQNIFNKQLDVAVALHNEKIMTDKINHLLEEALSKVLFAGAVYDRTQTGWISSVALTPSTISVNNQANAKYFADMLCRKVDFLGAIEKLADDSIALEVAPCGLFESQLRQLACQQGDCQAKFLYVKMMRRSVLPEEQALVLVESLGDLYQAGAELDFINFNQRFQAQDSERVVSFPVRRQTPSLSSLFQWNHEQSVFVPRYPIQFSKSSAKCEMPIDIVQDRDKYIAGHCVEGRILFPATGYLCLIWRVFSFTKRQLYDACFQDVENHLVPIEFHNVRLLRAVILGNRLTQLYIHLEEGTGRFEIKEGGSVVVEGYAKSPVESPEGLLYDHVRQRIQEENLELTLSSDDIYKQFRVSGYDYGETFQNIEAASADGRYCKVKHNGHFTALTDSILQSIFLAVSQYAPSGGLFLPTRFDYVRFQPEIILDKLRKANVAYDLSSKALDTKEKREIMTKMMQREGAPREEEPAEKPEEEKEEGKREDEEPKPVCIFETYCDPITGIIITDGIEMRGIKASPAPRRFDQSEVLLESYQFVEDMEDPINDENLTGFERVHKRYAQVCDTLSIGLLNKLFGKKKGINKSKLEEITASLSVENDHSLLLSEEIVDHYKKEHLTCIYKKDQEKKTTETKEGEKNEADEYDIKKNGNRMLLSVLDQLSSLADGQQISIKQVKEEVEKNRLYLMQDLLQSSTASERVMRPLVETVIENICVKKMKLRLMEINVDDGIMKDSLQLLIKNIEPSLSLDYSLAHPDIKRLNDNKIVPSNQAQTYTMKDLQTLFSENSQLRDLDCIVYKDISCYSLPKQVIELNGLAPVLTSLNNGVHVNGYIMVIMRQMLTLAERILLSLSEPELVGLRKQDLDRINSNKLNAASAAAAKINHINTVLESRCKLMLSEAERNEMICLAKKSDQVGCTVMLFKTTKRIETEKQKQLAGIEEAQPDLANPTKRVLLRVTHQDKQDINSWLEELKSCFKKEEEPKPAAEGGEQGAAPEQDENQATNGVSDEQEEKGEEKAKQQVQVWLCAVETKQNALCGVIGFMQALRRELGSANLRCYYDQFTFKNYDEPVTMADIEQCDRYQEALRRNLIWNCVDSSGRFGSFRHFTINDYMSHEECLCAKTDDGNAVEPAAMGRKELQPAKGAYVNNAVRGDLSSFTWFETPYKYLSARERRNLVQVAYSALNFRDIMLATGRLPLDAIPIQIAMQDCLLGLEFSGIDSSGKRVAGMVSGRGIATEVYCPELASIMLEVPDEYSLEEAATVPVVYATVVMALIYRGKMQAGESILIHAGSGGVGQAAIRLAAHHGLKIFTTVGSDEKRKFLLEEFGHCLSDDRIFSSRTCEFEQKIMEATCGRGVDLVLNSLADDKLQASVRCLADGGRFLEIGKYDMSTNAPLELRQLDTNKTFHGILLDMLFDTTAMGSAFKSQLKCVVNTLKTGMKEGFIKPIKHTVFKKRQIEEAFRYMATGKHTGKILIEIKPELDAKQKSASPRLKSPACIARFQLSPEKSYIVTGGLGGFGLELIKWLVLQGARKLVITSRSGLRTGYQRVTLDRLTSNNKAEFLIVDGKMADTTTREGVEYLYRSALEQSPVKQVGGVFHLAMVLKDTLLENMSADDFELVCKPKVDTFQHLDEISREQSLAIDFFVGFSSVSCGKGNAGQSNYAYANSCLERICEKRRRRGIHGLAIQWGAIGDVGVAFENLGGNDIVIGGTIPQRMPSCFATLSRLLCAPFSTCLSVVPVARNTDGVGEKGDLVGAIMHVLGIKDPSKVSDQATLGELGLDSLMAVEIRQYIEREYDRTLNIQEIRALTIAKIREISENEKPSKSGDKSRQQPGDKPKLREVQSYGTKQGAIEAAPKTALRVANEAIEAAVNKNMIASFVPQLELPKAEYRRLNMNYLNNGIKQAAVNGKTNGYNGYNGTDDGRPIFFFPPIHGEFNQLEKICSTVKRPCIGLNWTLKQGRVRSVKEAVDSYLELLERVNWHKEFSTSSLDNGYDESERVVDLVGYSYGATIAFEMMLQLHKLQRRSGRRASSFKKPTLLPGHLVLLDGSPKQIELGSQMASHLTSNKPMKLGEKVDELLMAYVLSHTRNKEVDYIGLQASLSKLELEEKIKFASKKLAQILGLDQPTKKPVKQSAEDENNDQEGETVDKVTEIAYAMEAFLRRYELIANYKTGSSLPGSCTLIRAEKMYLSNQKSAGYNEDLDLGSIVKGDVHLFVMKGDHETFLDNNYLEIGGIIAKHCSG